MNPQEPDFSPVDPAAGTQPQTASAGFCQQCGIPLTEQTRRTVAGAVYCEPCLATRLAGAPFPGAATQAPYAPWVPGSVPPPSAPNPGLAALLGFIPGVGAMYNEQYAKGIAHLTIFALLVVLTDANGIFGLFIAGWEFYMAIEAHHTARARLDGTPLPNPFGFNDLGERLGFTKGWGSPGTQQGTRPVYPAADPAAGTLTGTSGYSGAVAPGPPPVVPPSAESWSEAYPAQPFFQNAPAQRFAETAYTPMPPEPLTPVPPLSPAMRFPAGAVWLILLGVIFLLSTTGIFREFSGEALLGWGFIGLAAWIFLRRFKELLLTEPTPLRRVARSLESSVWILTSGVLALLDSFNVLSWSRSWPIFIIVAGVMALLGRISQQQAGLSAGPGSSIGSAPGSTL